MKTTYHVLSPLHHDGQRYDVGAAVALDDQAARPLIANGTVAAAEESDPAPSVATLGEAIAALVAEDPEKQNAAWWTTDGKPETKALAARLGVRVTARERDLAWEAALAG